MALRNFWVEYLTQQDTGGLTPEQTAPGWFRAKQIYTGHDELAVVAEAQQAGFVAQKVTEIKPRLKLFDRVSREYKQEFLAAILYNMTSGMSAGKAFQTTVESETGAIRERMDIPVRVLERGGSFAEAIRAAGFFDNTTIAILDAGERTGNTRQALETAIEHYKSWSAGMKSLIGIATLVAIDFSTALSTVVGVRWSLLPMLTEGGIKTEDEAKLRAFKNGVDNAYLVNDILLYLAVALLLVAVACALIMVADNPEPKRWLNRQLNRVPYLSDALLHSAVATSMKVSSSLLIGGVTFFKALDIVQHGTRHETVKNYWDMVTKRVEGGIPVGRALKSTLLDNTEQVAIAAHTNQIQLGQIMQRMSLRRTDMAQKATRKFTFFSIGLTMLYIMVSIGVALWVMKLQNSAMMAGL